MFDHRATLWVRVSSSSSRTKKKKEPTGTNHPSSNDTSEVPVARGTTPCRWSSQRVRTLAMIGRRYPLPFPCAEEDPTSRPGDYRRSTSFNINKKRRARRKLYLASPTATYGKKKNAASLQAADGTIRLSGSSHAETTCVCGCGYVLVRSVA